MTNVYGRPEKAKLRKKLFGIGVQALEEEGFKVERVQGSGKSSVRRIRKGSESKLISIRTTQDTWIAFPRDDSDQKWVTLSDVDAVVAVSVDDPVTPKFANVHFIRGDEIRYRFDRAYEARKAAGHKIPLGRGVWVSLYHEDALDPPNRAGAGAGLDNPPIARVLLSEAVERNTVDQNAEVSESDMPLTIAEAKKRLAQTHGVDPECVRITIEA